MSRSVADHLKVIENSTAAIRLRLDPELAKHAPKDALKSFDTITTDQLIGVAMSSLAALLGADA